MEQLRTHMKHLNALHPPDRHNGRTMVQLYEKGYGKDAAGIAMEAIKFARDSAFDVVLVDTAGRMQVGILTKKMLHSRKKSINRKISGQ